MEYTIKKLAEMAGVSTRTLRYYDQIGLLKPCRISSSGYRIYGEKEVDLLQHILFYKSMGMDLESINNIVSNPDFDINNALLRHREELIEKRKRLDQLIITLEKTIKYKEGLIKMTDKEKFEGFKKEKLEENEKKYGKEIREKYGEGTVKSSNKKFMNLSSGDFERMTQLEEEMIEALKVVNKTKDLSSKEVKIVYENHKEWLSFTWPTYSKEAHAGLAKMYVLDERFAKYYNDKSGEEVVSTLKDIIEKFTK